MIPKIIHYIWLGGNPIPPAIQACIDSWKQKMPDFKLMLWDDEAIREIDMLFVKEALSVKKWAFASDVIRLWALAKYGGIYVDTDVKVLRSFEPLLTEHAFIGREGCMQINYHTTSYHLTSYCFGAEKENSYIEQCLSYYKDRHFIISNNDSLANELRFDMRNASYIHSEMARLFGYNPSALAPSMQRCRDGVLTVFPPEYFAEGGASINSYCTHLSIGSWRDQEQEKEIYTLSYKISWRIRWGVEKILGRFGYIMLKLN